MAATSIQKCTCEHEFQDKRYGKGMRVHNVSKDLENCQCTVCSAGKLVKQGGT